MECVKLVDDVVFGKPIVCCLGNKEKLNTFQIVCRSVLTFDKPNKIIPFLAGLMARALDTTYRYRSRLMLCWWRSPGVDHGCYHFPACEAAHGLVHDYRGRGG